MVNYKIYVNILFSNAKISYITHKIRLISIKICSYAIIKTAFSKKQLYKLKTCFICTPASNIAKHVLLLWL